ncbi:unnamed protein product [Triticum turgidum subsp. durum]|uniref:F-box domain-containing protein n=3 Tax=Triticum TaxID=4564 RepID=A0A9R0ZP58_TRITD|nr:unnamed protein product [Triticum turgidum subsp. durum]
MPPAGPAFPLYSDDVLGEIFLRLGPLKPSLLRASRVCKQWRSLASDPGFRRRFGARHRQPSLLGVFTQQHGEALFRSVPLDPPVIPSERFSLRGYGSWDLLGCRHGRVLIINHTEGKAIVHHPITGDQHRIEVPWEFRQNGVVANINGAVLCTGMAENKGHIHGACRSSPFKIVLVRAYTAYSAKRDLTYHMAHACVYSSKTRTWGKDVSALLPCDSYIPGHHSVFAGNALYWYLPGYILKFDMGMESLRVIRKLPVAKDCYDTSHIIRSKGGGVGIAFLSYPTFQVWDMKNFKKKNNCHGGTRWALRKPISLELGCGSGIRMKQAIVGYDEDGHQIFFRVGSNIFIVELVSMKSSKLWRSYSTHKYHPYTCYYTAALETSADNASMTYGGDQENTAQGGSVQI